MFKSLTTVALLAGLAATPAAALTFTDAFSSFNGTQGAGNFSYGSFDGTSFTPFTSSDCSPLGGTICLGSLPGAYKTNSGAHQFGTVAVPDDRLVLHPGSGNDVVYIAFTAPTAGTYLAFAEFNVQDNSPTGVDISFFFITGNVLQFVAPIDSLSSGNPTAFHGGFGALGTGDSIGYIIDKGTTYNNDSTGVNFAVASIPEPATWTLLIGGFAMTGFAQRLVTRRRAAPFG